MAKTQRAAWLPGVQKDLEVGPAPYPNPGPTDVVIKTHAVAINPVDTGIIAGRFPVSSWPTIMGCDLAGEVVEIGSDVAHLVKGQRVMAHATSLLTNKNEHAAYQEYILSPEIAVSPIPDNMAFEDATVLPLALSTAAAGLYDVLKLPRPAVENTPQSNKAILVWGGSSSVGSAAIQLAVAAGIKVIATASPRNFDFCKQLGAAEVFDRAAPDVVSDVIKALTKYDFVGIYDAISQPETQLKGVEIVSHIGKGSIAAVLPLIENPPANIDLQMVFAPVLFGPRSELGKWLYIDFLPKALASGVIKPSPKPKVFGHGLNSIQGAIKDWQKGVSASKIVVTL